MRWGEGVGKAGLDSLCVMISLLYGEICPLPLPPANPLISFTISLPVFFPPLELSFSPHPPEYHVSLFVSQFFPGHSVKGKKFNSIVENVEILNASRQVKLFRILELYTS